MTAVFACFLNHYFSNLTKGQAQNGAPFAQDSFTNIRINGGEYRTLFGGEHLAEISSLFAGGVVTLSNSSVVEAPSGESVTGCTSGTVVINDRTTSFFHSATLFCAKKQWFVAGEVLDITEPVEEAAAEPVIAAPVVVEAPPAPAPAAKAATPEAAPPKGKKEAPAAPADAAPAPKAAAGPKTWAALASTPAQPYKPAAKPPTDKAVAPKKPAHESRRPHVLCKVYFSSSVEVDKDAVRAAMVPSGLQKDLLDIRIIPKDSNVHFFLEFSCADALQILQAHPPTIGGHKVVAVLQKPKSAPAAQ